MEGRNKIARGGKKKSTLATLADLTVASAGGLWDGVGRRFWHVFAFAFNQLTPGLGAAH